MFDFILALSMILNPNEVTYADMPVIVAVADIMEDIALRIEILDQREARFFFNFRMHPENMTTIRNRYKDHKDLPYTADAYRFPDKETINAYMTFNREFRAHIDKGMNWPTHYNRDNIRMVISETDKLYNFWDAVRDTQVEYYYVTAKRRALQKVKERLGDEAYYNMILPPAVPAQYFRVID